ncbi:MAG TPA: FAD-linked oxidase C-terminal domain-containing protein, partial [Puia sp.]|nr:FAD-linked oxidase C-terminal domain-containing protein [Puia sp.]
DLVELVIKKYDGALKAEHGTGRNMAPFVETAWGSEAYRIMERLKKCIDPENLLNPGVILNKDPQIHIKNLKQLFAVEEEVDKCIECGYCEQVCPSRNLTMTPRRRIIARRELKRLQLAGETGKYRVLLKQYEYEGLETCAVDGLCASACPVDINTGDLVKRLRMENHSRLGNLMALFLAKNFRLVEFVLKYMLHAGNRINYIFGKQTMYQISRLAKKCWRGFPLWTDQIGVPPAIPESNLYFDNGMKKENIEVIYFPACISRLLGNSDGVPNVMETMIRVSKKAGVRVIIPKHLTGTCCGQIFSSKGLTRAYRATVNNIINYLWKASSEGRLPIVTDTSSCAYTFQHIRPGLTDENKLRFDSMHIMDSVDYLHDVILPLTGRVRKKENVVLHPVCSLGKMGSSEKFKRIARHFAKEVTIPIHSGCCGMAGDRGFLFPELTHSATLAEAKEVSEKKYDGYYSSARTCEMAMAEAVKQNYESIIYLADRAMI